MTMTVDKIICVICSEMSKMRVPKLLPGEYPSPSLNAANTSMRKTSTKTSRTRQSPKFEDARSASPSPLSTKPIFSKVVKISPNGGANKKRTKKNK